MSGKAWLRLNKNTLFTVEKAKQISEAEIHPPFTDFSSVTSAGEYQ